MPLFGIVNDSPIIYFGQRIVRRQRRLARARSVPGVFGGLGRGRILCLLET